jgi:hypothetical protein
MKYEDRIKNWQVHAMLIERNITMGEYLAEKMAECKPIDPDFKRTQK